MEEDTYTTGQAAHALGMTDRGIRKMIDRGELEAYQDDRGRHLIPQRVIHEMRKERRAARTPAEIPDDEAARGVEEARELRQRVEDLREEIGVLRGQLQLTEKAESTVRAERERTESTMREERERLERLLEEERGERRRLQEALDDARQQVAARPWWRRMFGG